MTSKNVLQFPLSNKLLRSSGISFQSRYTAARTLLSEWNSAFLEISFDPSPGESPDRGRLIQSVKSSPVPRKPANERCLPDSLNLAWIGEWRDTLFQGEGQFQTPADLRSLALAVRETLGSESFGMSLDLAPNDFWLIELPEAISTNLALGLIPPINDFCRAVGLDLDETLREAIDGWRLDKFLKKLNQELKGNCLSESSRSLVMKLATYDPTRRSRQPKAVRKEWQMGDPDLPRWRIELLQFCCDAVHELAFRGYVVDPLPEAYGPKQTFVSLVNDLLRRANDGDRYGKKSGTESELSKHFSPFVGSQKPTHAPDFSSVDCGLGRFNFTKQQRILVAALWNNWEADGSGLSASHLLKLVGSTGTRLRDAFKRNKAFGMLIVKNPAGADIFKLNLELPRE